MKIKIRFVIALLYFSGLFSAMALSAQNRKSITFPYKNKGLTEKQAAAHMLGRLSYGAKPGQIDAVVKQGLERWFMEQLDAKIPDDTLDKMLDKYEVRHLTIAQTLLRFPKGIQVEKRLLKNGTLKKDSPDYNNKKRKELVTQHISQNGLRPTTELSEEFIGQKILRSAYGNNQLQEVMTSFWLNHFNVSMTKSQVTFYINSYERDVIRPKALGHFGDLLLATAKSPAMLYFLDNYKSTANNRKTGAPASTSTKGLNENYAREVMELHTLGVDGGYTQKDVTEAARVLTGWAIYPFRTYDKDPSEKSAGLEKNAKPGFIYEDNFVFNPNNHDQGSKTVLGKKFGNDGYTEGVALLDLLAHHSATAQFICKKIAIRFVSDSPPQPLIDKMAKTFTEKDGQISEVLITMVTSPEFWDSAAIRQKTKSPFELAIGAVRNLNARIDRPYKLFQQISKMGEKMYYYQAPTGFPDQGQYWINTGSLLNRMNFGLAFAEGRIPGVSLNLAALNGNHEPESTQAALATYSKLIMPERDLEQTIKRLTPILNDPKLAEKVSEKAAKKTPSKPNADPETEPVQTPAEIPVAALPKAKQQAMMLKQVVGIIIGSPEYQRR